MRETERETDETANYSFLMNDLFDLFNVSRPVMDARYTRKAFDLEMEKQTKLLNESYDYISNMRHPTEKALFPFQRGLLQDIKALRMLHQHLIIEKYSFVYYY